MTCADSKCDGHRLDTGTLPTSAMTARSFRHPSFEVGNGNTAQNARKYLKETANWVRPSGKDEVIWDLLDSTKENSAPPPRPPPPSPPLPPPPPCKRSGLYSDYGACLDKCAGGKCESGSAGFPIPQTYYASTCPVSASACSRVA